MAECPADQAEELSIALGQVMGDATAVMLRGYRLPTDRQIVRPGKKFARFNLMLRVIIIRVTENSASV
jgi:hypothetical protein